MKSENLMGALKEAQNAEPKVKAKADKGARREAFLAKKKEIDNRYKTYLEQMREGNSSLFQNFLNVAARMPENELFKNLVLIAGQRPEAVLIKPGYVWKKMGHTLPPADRAITLYVKGDTWVDPKTERTGTYYNPKDCYDATDIQGIRWKTSPQQMRAEVDGIPEYDETIAAICTVVSDPEKYETESRKDVPRRPVTLAISAEQQADAAYDPTTSTIMVRQGLPPKECCEGIIMELCHRERYLGGWETSTRTKTDMFIAYAATYVICKKLFLPTSDFDFPAAFLEAKDAAVFEKELRSIVKTANVVGERLEAERFSMKQSAKQREMGTVVNGNTPAQEVQSWQ